MSRIAFFIYVMRTIYFFILCVSVAFAMGCQKREPIQSEYKNQEIIVEPKYSMRKDGPYKLVDARGQILAQGEYKNKEFSGVVNSYYPNGRVKEVKNYQNGQLINK